MTEISRRLEALRQEKQAELDAIPPMTRREAYEKGYYTISRQVAEAISQNWTEEDWMNAVAYTVRLTD